jgi:hypothetical protein
VGEAMLCQKCRSEIGNARVCPHCLFKRPSGSLAFKVVFGFFVVLSILWVIGSLMGPTTAPPELRRVTYTVQDFSFDNNPVELTYQNQSGGTEQRKVSMPWNLEIKARSGAFLYLSAQKQGERGTIHATIYIDGQVLQQADSDSPYGIASVSGRVP